MKSLKNVAIRIRSILLILVLATSQVAGATGPLMKLGRASAASVSICTNDVQGPNDEPGQKDLNLLCKYTDDIAGELTVAWQWDEIAWSGSNTGDACALFDTNNNNFSNYAVCVTVSGNLAAQSGVSPRIYTCNDTALEKCAGASLVVGPYQTTCSVSISSTDPFTTGASKDKGASQPKDTRALCVIKLSEVGAGSAVLKDVCSFPSQQPNSDPSDCVITPTVHVPSATINVVKSLIPVTDNGAFTLTISGVNATATGGDGTQTGVTDVTPGTAYTISEVGANGTPLNNYTTSAACYNGNTLLPGSGSKTGASIRSIIVTPSDNNAIVCTFTNTLLQAHLTLVKTVTNNNGGGALANAWTLSADGPTPLSGVTGTSAVSNAAVNSGAYSLSENGPVGYTGTYSCVKNVGSAIVSNSITLAPADNATCTINNDDNPAHLIVIKHVVNNSGGSAVAGNFPTTISGVTTATPTAAGVESPGVDNVLTTVGSYNVVEGAHVGYEMTSVGCSGTIALGETKTCTITNTAIAPTLTLKKIAINNNGGIFKSGDFTLHAGGSNFTGGTSVVDSQDSTKTTSTYTTGLGVGPYTLSEDTKTGYTGGGWGCTSGFNGSTVTIALADNITCTITNYDDVPSLTLNKIFVNNYGSTETAASWLLTATSNNYTVGYVATNLSGQGVDNSTTDVVSDSNFKASSYSLNEVGPTTGFSNLGWSCDNTVVENNVISVLLGQHTTCTITNTAIQPKIKVIKHVDNGNNIGASLKSAVNFTMTVNAGHVTPSSSFAGSEAGTTVGLDEGSYNVSENTDSAYQASYSSDCNSSITVGVTKTCTVTNTAISPKLKLVKSVVNNSGGEANADAWTLNAIDAQTNTGLISAKGTIVPNNNNLLATTTPATAIAGVTYTLSESGGPDGYLGSTYSCVKNGQAAVVANSITLALGDTATCTVTNDDLKGTLTINKVVVNDNSGNAKASDFSFTKTADATNYNFLDGATTLVGSRSFAVNAGTYSAIENSFVGYTMTGNTCVNVVINNGGTASCTITNDDIAHPGIQVVKSGPATAHEGEKVTYTFTVTNTGDTPLSGATVIDNIAGKGAVLESGDTNKDTKLDKTETWVYTLDYVIPANQSANVHNTVTVCGTDSLKKEVCDTDEHDLDVLGMVVVTKYNDLNRNGIFDANDKVMPELALSGWTMSLDKKTQVTGQDGTTTFEDVLPSQTPYILDEVQQDSWKLSAITCDNDRAIVEDSFIDRLINIVTPKGHSVTVTPGKTVNCFIGNYRNPVLNIAKSNNRPNPTNTGDIVTYTLVVSVPEDSGAVFNGLATDLPPKKFTYVLGSWTAKSSIRGDIKALNITTEPTYGSPGTWMLGDMAPGEIVTLTYKANIESSVGAGTYNDLAFAAGCSIPSDEGDCTNDKAVLSNMSVAVVPFVGTKVKVTVPQVLGASTTRVLAVTGSSLTLVYLVALTNLTVLAVVLRRRSTTKGGPK